MDTAAFASLQQFCEACDRADEARAIVAKDGLGVHDRFKQTRAHPCIAIERDAIATAIRAWRALGFDQPPPVPEKGAARWFRQEQD